MRPFVPPVSEAGVRLDADELVALVVVHDVDHPEAAGTELRRLLVAHRTQHLMRAQPVADAHRLVEHEGVVAHHRFGEVEARLQVEVDCNGTCGSVRPGRQ